MLHKVGVSFDLYYDARKHKIKILNDIVNRLRLLGLLFLATFSGVLATLRSDC